MPGITALSVLLKHTLTSSHGPRCRVLSLAMPFSLHSLRLHQPLTTHTDGQRVVTSKVHVLSYPHISGMHYLLFPSGIQQIDLHN